MDKVFVLQHSHELKTGEDDIKLIGVYRTAREATEAIERAVKKPGFCDAPDGFSMDAYDLGKDHWAEGYVTQP